MNDQSWLKSVKPEYGYYIAGFTDGEGSFNVSLKKRLDYKQKWKITASFNISQKDRVILSFIKKVLGCGTIRERKDGVVYYEVTNINSLQDKIIPFFKKFGFMSAKKKQNFFVFTEIVKKISKGEHHSKKDFLEIIELREKLNMGAGRKRKYSLKDIER